MRLAYWNSAKSDLELLRTEIETLWGMDDQGRITGSPLLVIAAATDGSQAAVAATRVPELLAAELVATVVGIGASCADPSDQPAAMDACQRLLADAGWPVEVTSGPSYLIPPGITFETSARIVLSNAEDVEVVRHANPGNWEADEWRDLLDGRLGPWAMAVEEDRVISICHTPRCSARGAEAGVWTHPDFRGRGHAAAVTAAWAALMEPTGRRLFYSTSASNHSSQGVAARLVLRPIGWLWILLPAIGER
ncbi:GNAT family N-acetyltransferase [Actinopolymorpha alba]|uniref:GNAT family N-acetyltransferase n=1 Tax=Actinopolymorpha alba TaxID=533267 RepID=UPI000364A27A|nr:GNAT family N-acetyltransferase [Actinopolymorpha alba]